MKLLASSGNEMRFLPRRLARVFIVAGSLLLGFSLQAWAQNSSAGDVQPSEPTLRTEGYWRYEVGHRAIYGEALPALPERPGDPYAQLNAKRFRQAEDMARSRRSILGDAKAVPFVGIMDVGREDLPQVIALVLHQLHVQAEIVSPTQDLAPYSLLILGAIEDLPKPEWPSIESYVRNGGTLLTSIESGMVAKAMWEDWGDPLWRRTYSLFGFHVEANSVGGMNGYLQLDPAVRRGAIDRGCLIKGPFWEVLAPDNQKLGKLVLPWQNLSHGFVYMQGPPDQVDLSPGVTATRFGKGKAVFVTLPVFYALRETGFTCIQDILVDMINYLLPRPPFKMQAPPNLECSLMSREDSLLLNLVYYYPNRAVTPRLEIEDSVPLRNVSISIRTGDRPQAVWLKPDGTPLNYQFKDGYTMVEIPALTGWQILELSRSLHQ
jgi:hypothetical protein